jgi:signal transduction histidine kinase
MPPLLANLLAALAYGRPAGAARELRLSSEPRGLAEVYPDPAPLSEPALAAQLLLPVVIFVISFLSIDFSRLSNFVETLWPSNAVLLVALFRHARTVRSFGSILAGGAAGMTCAAFIFDHSATLCITLTAANIIEIGVAYVLLSMFRINASNLTSFANLLIFILIAGGLTPIGSAVIGASAFGAAHELPWHAVWRNWYPAHALGMIILAPFLISITSREWHAMRIAERAPEAAATFVLFVALAICAAYFRSLIFLTAPAILFATVRFGLVGAALATLITAFLSGIFVVEGLGQPMLSQPELSQRILALQAFLTITSLWSLPTAALLTERDRLLEDLSRANSLLMAESEKISHVVTGLRRHLSLAEEKERLRLSHELHDQAGQSLIAAILDLNEIDPLVDGAAQARLHLVRKKMEEMGKTLHRIAWELRPPSIDELGLCKALDSYIADWGEQCGTEVDFHCEDPSIDEIPTEIGTTVYRVVQEGLTNIVKHAQRPSNVSVVIRRPDATLQVIIEDNGCGFDVAALGAKHANHPGLGLDGMRERLSLIGGTLEIESTPGAGTTLFARIAIDDQRSAA